MVLGIRNTGRSNRYKRIQTRYISDTIPIKMFLPDDIQRYRYQQDLRDAGEDSAKIQ